MITYRPFWETLKNKNMTQYKLINTYHISAGQLSRLRANAPISTHTIDVLCDILDCNVNEIMEHTKES